MKLYFLIIILIFGCTNTNESNEIKSKLIKIRPRTLGQALRIDGVTPAAAILLLGYIKRNKRILIAWK